MAKKKAAKAAKAPSKKATSTQAVVVTARASAIVAKAARHNLKGDWWFDGEHVFLLIEDPSKRDRFLTYKIKPGEQKTKIIGNELTRKDALRVLAEAMAG